LLREFETGLDRRITNTRDGKPVWSDPVAAAEKEHPLHATTVASPPERPKPADVVIRPAVVADSGGQRCDVVTDVAAAAAKLYG
jgi:hypothetical protein